MREWVALPGLKPALAGNQRELALPCPAVGEGHREVQLRLEGLLFRDGDAREFDCMAPARLQHLAARAQPEWQDARLEQCLAGAEQVVRQVVGGPFDGNGGGAEGERAMADFDSTHAAALAHLNERWTLEAKVAEERGLVLQTLAYDPDNAPRLNADLRELRAAEAKLKAFKAKPVE